MFKKEIECIVCQGEGTITYFEVAMEAEGVIEVLKAGGLECNRVKTKPCYYCKGTGKI